MLRSPSFSLPTLDFPYPITHPTKNQFYLLLPLESDSFPPNIVEECWKDHSWRCCTQMVAKRREPFSKIKPWSSSRPWKFKLTSWSSHFKMYPQAEPQHSLSNPSTSNKLPIPLNYILPSINSLSEPTSILYLRVPPTPARDPRIIPTIYPFWPHQISQTPF